MTTDSPDTTTEARCANAELDAKVVKLFYGDRPLFWRECEQRLGARKSEVLLDYLSEFYLGVLWLPRECIESAFSMAADRLNIEYCRGKHAQLALFGGGSEESVIASVKEHQATVLRLASLATLLTVNVEPKRLVIELGISEYEAESLIGIAMSIQAPLTLASLWSLRCSDDISLVEVQGKVNTLMERLRELEQRIGP